MGEGGDGMKPTTTRARARTFSAPCAGCQVGQGRNCRCVRHVRREVPVWAWQVLIYGGSAAIVVGLARWLWGWA